MDGNHGPVSSLIFEGAQPPPLPPETSVPESSAEGLNGEDEHDATEAAMMDESNGPSNSLICESDPKCEDEQDVTDAVIVEFRPVEGFHW